jgi:hypothetical protein
LPRALLRGAAIAHFNKGVANATEDTMNPRLQALAASIRAALPNFVPARGLLVAAVVLGAAGYGLYTNPPVRTV